MWRGVLLRVSVKFCVLVALLGLLFMSHTAYAMPGWAYMVPVTITNNSGSTLTNYQVLVELDTQVLIAQGKMRPDGGDIRFSADLDGTTLIDCWVESGINTANTRIWVEAPSLPASSATTIYLFYGNSGATSQSDFASTFPNRYQLTSGSDTLGGTQTYDWFEVSGGATLRIQDGQILTVRARMIRINGTLEGPAAGYDGARAAAQSNGSGPGFGYGSTYNGGGAGYGGQGGCAPGLNASTCAQPSGATYGTPGGSDIDMGSGGGSGKSSPPNNRGGDGGGAVRLQAQVVEVTGPIRVNGEDGVASSSFSYGGGGGSGGEILIEGDQVNLSGAALSARGGRAGNQYGGAGGGGRIKVFYSDSLTGSYSTDVAGETTHTYGGTVGLAAARGLNGTTFAGTFISAEPTASLGSETVLNDLSIAKTVVPTTIEPGQPLTYVLTFSKIGPITATGVIIADIVPAALTNPGFMSSGAIITPTAGPAFTWQVQDLAPGQGGIITITGVLSTGLPAGVLTNAATITSTVVEADTTNNDSMVEVTIANVAPQFTSTPVTGATEGQAYTYAITASDADAEDTLSITAPTKPAWLTLSDHGDGTATLGGTPTHADVGDHSVVLQVTDGMDAVSQPFTVTVHEESTIYVYLPLAFRNHVVAPDLVVDRIIATSNSVQVVIKNQGNAPVTDDFWVDVYINPDLIPTAVNQTWDQRGSQGLVWGVSSDVQAGGVIVLAVGDTYFLASYSQVSWPLPIGTPVYAQVDSYDAATNYGAVLENHEITGGAYNNISTVVFATTGATVTGGKPPARHSVTDGRLPISYSNLPPR